MSLREDVTHTPSSPQYQWESILVLDKCMEEGGLCQGQALKHEGEKLPSAKPSLTRGTSLSWLPSAQHTVIWPEILHLTQDVRMQVTYQMPWSITGWLWALGRKLLQWKISLLKKLLKFLCILQWENSQVLLVKRLKKFGGVGFFVLHHFPWPPPPPLSNQIYLAFVDAGYT